MGGGFKEGESGGGGGGGGGGEEDGTKDVRSPITN